MAGRIRDEDIAVVRERSPIDEVVGEYLQLRNAGGGSLKGLCPFHDEKTPSFNVTPARGLWYCFSCADGGDVIKFVEKIDNLSFPEAVERLAARAGIELRYEQGGHVPGQEQSQRRRLLEAHKAAAEFYAERLRGAAAGPAREFLSERGFELADAERFGAGYSPPEWEALTRHLRGRGFTDAELMTGGLASQGRRGPVDRFRGRLMWPIRDLTGDVIAFGARKLAADDDGAKYLNTPETPLFKKSSVLYGADLAKRDIAQRRQAVVVEGYTDVMACHLAGITDRGGDQRDLVRRRPHQDPAAAADGFRQAPRGGHLHLRRRRGRAAGGRCARSTLRSGSSRRRSWRCSRTASTRATCGSSTATPPSATWSLSACRSTSSPSAVSWANYNLGHQRGPAGRAGRRRPDHRPDQGLRACATVTPSAWTGGSA